MYNPWMMGMNNNLNMNNNKKNIDAFRQLIRDFKKFKENIDIDTIYQLLESYGKMDEYIEFAPKII